MDNNKWDRKHNDVNTNDDVDDCVTQHINDCVALSQREFDPPSPTATASPVSSPCDPFPGAPEFEYSPEPLSIPFCPPLRQVAEVWSISTETEEYSYPCTSATIWYEEELCIQDRSGDEN